MENLDVLDNFLGESTKKESKKTKKDENKVFIDKKDGLVERFDKIYVTKDGKQLLREVY